MSRDLTRWVLFDCLGNGRDVLWGITTAATSEVEEACTGEVGELVVHILRLKVETCWSERIGHACIGVAGYKGFGHATEFGQEGAHFIRA